MGAFEEMNIVRGDQTDSEFLRQLGQNSIAFVLPLDALIMHLEVKIVGTKNIAEVRQALAGFRHIIRLDRHVDFALETTA